jgi:hypothetical protein
LFYSLFRLYNEIYHPYFAVVINQKNNVIANKALDVATSYLERNDRYGAEVGNIAYVENEGEDGQEFLDASKC